MTEWVQLLGGEGKRKRGGQPGHGGHKRELLPADEVERLVELYPGKCENYQVTEVPPIRPHKVFDYWQNVRAGKLDRGTFRAWMVPVRAQFEACLARAAS